MKLAFPSFSSKSLVGLDIGSSSVKAVELSKKGKGKEFDLTHVGVASLAPEAIVQGAFLNSSAIADTIREATENVLGEVEVPRSAFEQVARYFIDDQRRHMEMEEADIFPLALDVLTPEDWAEIDAKITAEQDPVSDPKTGEEFQALRDAILAWDRENQTPGH